MASDSLGGLRSVGAVGRSPCDAACKMRAIAGRAADTDAATFTAVGAAPVPRRVDDRPARSGEAPQHLLDFLALVSGSRAHDRTSSRCTVTFQGDWRLWRVKRRGDQPEHAVSREEVPTRADVLDLLNATPPPWRAAVALGVAGLRLGEAFGMCKPACRPMGARSPSACRRSTARERAPCSTPPRTSGRGPSPCPARRGRATP